MTPFSASRGSVVGALAAVIAGCLAEPPAPEPWGPSSLPEPPVPVGSVWLAPAFAVSIGTPQRPSIEVLDLLGRQVTDRQIKWTTLDSSVAIVDATGLITGVALGTAAIVAEIEGESAETLVHVVPPTLVGAGDVASCRSDGDEATALLLDTIPGTVFVAGDVVYESGSSDEFMNCYAASWGRHKDRTRPAPGNHEYYTPGAAGYYAYFGWRAGDPDKGYYSYDVGDWHVVVINSNIDVSTGSPQEQWLRADLAAHPAVCTIAYWHHPLFSSGDHGSHSTMRPIWQALYDADADVVISGHDHIYERFAPQTPTGQADMIRGIREFIVGTGGRSLLGFALRIAANSELRDNTAYGVLKLTLNPTSYSWEFVPVAGANFRDSGSGSCR